MGSFMYLSTLISLQILLSCFHLLVSMQPPCDDNDRANLLEFKQASWLISMFLRTLQLIQRLQVGNREEKQ